ncbi:MAG: VOC family protein [Verrucomicrobiales bacterium]|nr:VOC family protein [Verrucomicrobiales bacterium]
MKPADRRFENTIPVLPVSNLAGSIDFYTGTLGFGLDWGGEEGSRICSVSRDGCCIMLSQGFGASSPQWVWIGQEDESIFQEWKEAGVTVKQEPKNWTWACEMKFEDPDGNIL